jgi:4-amino-4-deoxychorismate lyase
MSLLFETIKVVHRSAQNLDLHNERVARSRRELLKLHDELDLRTHITIPAELGEGVYRCRIAYDKTVDSVEFQPYRYPSITTVRLVQADHVRYHHKFSRREVFSALVRDAGADEVLMVVGGEITDFSIANIALFDGCQWVTPANPMLPGIKRRLLLGRDELRAEKLTPADLRRYSKAAPINALLDIGDVPFIEIENIRW